MIDFIGDIHGHASKLKQLLSDMQYELKNGAYHHLERKVVFIGDYIDRGLEIKETLDIRQENGGQRQHGGVDGES